MRRGASRQEPEGWLEGFVLRSLRAGEFVVVSETAGLHHHEDYDP